MELAGSEWEHVRLVHVETTTSRHVVKKRSQTAKTKRSLQMEGAFPNSKVREGGRQYD